MSAVLHQSIHVVRGSISRRKIEAANMAAVCPINIYAYKSTSQPLLYSSKIISYLPVRIALYGSMAAPGHTIGIIGAAISGPVFALQILSHPLLSKRFKPVIYEQLGPPETLDTSTNGKLIHTAGAAVGLFANGLFPLYELGLRKDLHSISSESSRLSLWRGGLDGHHRFCNTHKNQGWDADLQTCPRAVERRRLRNLLVGRFQSLGGSIVWEKKAQDVVSQDTGRVKVTFTDGESREVDLLVGSDGAWSVVRKYILEQRQDSPIAAKRWVPSSTGVAGIYGIS